MTEDRSFAIGNVRLLHPDGQLRPGHLLVRNGIIQTLLSPQERPQADTFFDGSGGILCPGFIDVHLQGLFGSEVWDEGEEGLLGLCRKAPQTGTTAFLATTEYTPESIARVLKGLREAGQTDIGARVLGLHLEGPYLNLNYTGALPRLAQPEPTPQALDRILEECQGLLRVMTIAPELPGHLELVRHLTRSGVIASLGHTGATYEEAMAGIQAGIRHATHLFNAMTPIHHRRPGAAVAVFQSPQVLAELICDTIHVHPSVIQMTHRLKGASGLMLITDAVRVAGLPDGTYRSKGHGYTLRRQQGAVRLEDGTLAGSCLTTDEALQNAVNHCGIPLEDALVMLTRTPAQLLDLTGERGVLAPGTLADLVLLDDDLRPARVWIQGRLVFERIR